MSEVDRDSVVEYKEVSDHNYDRYYPRDRFRGDRRRGRRTMSLLVRNLKYETSPEKLREVFEKFGSIRDVYLPLDYYTKKPRGFGFVEYYDYRDAEVALKEIDATEIDGNKVEVFAAKRGRSDPDQMKYRERGSRGRRSRSGSRGRRPRYRPRSRSVDRRNGYSRRYYESRRSNRYSRSRSPQRNGVDNRRSYSMGSRSRS